MKSIHELISLKGKTALLTGACGGMGRMISFQLAELGCDLLLLDKYSENLHSLKDEIRKDFSINIECITCDLECTSNRNKAISRVKRKGCLDILINNAAFGGTTKLPGWCVTFEKQALDTWKRAIEVNLTSVFHLTQGFCKFLSETNGSVINIGSIYGELGPDWSLYDGTSMGNPAAYSASKGGLIQLTRWLATTLAPNVRVNCISPGGIYRNQPKEFVERYEAKTPLKRMANEDDFKGIVTYLATNMSKYTTGQNFIIDGGYSIA